MSGEIGFNIQEEIVKRLPAKSILRFRSVCKAWRGLIDNPYFIAAHAVHQTKFKHLLVRYSVAGAGEEYVYIADDDTFPQQRFVPTLPLPVKLLQESSIVGSCNGLVCMEGCYYNPYKKPIVVIWNPAISKSIPIDVPGMSHEMDDPVFGFGVCPVTNDPKIVMLDVNEINNPREVMVYTLSSGNWRSLSSNVFSKSIVVNWCGQVIGKFMYWCGSHLKVVDIGVQYSSGLILSFDMTNDIFEVIDLPDSFKFHLSIFKIRESLVVLQERFFSDKTVWMMENGAQKSFTKLFTFSTPSTVLGFRKSGTLIMRVDYRNEESEIVVYEPDLEHFNDLEIRGSWDFFSVSPYMETLLLLGRSDCNNY